MSTNTMIVVGPAGTVTPKPRPYGRGSREVWLRAEIVQQKSKPRVAGTDSSA
jgi:hypothetical protein